MPPWHACRRRQRQPRSRALCSRAARSVIAAWADEQWASYSRQRYGRGGTPDQAVCAPREDRGASGRVRGRRGQGSVLRIGRLIVSPEWRAWESGLTCCAPWSVSARAGMRRVRLETLKTGPPSTSMPSWLWVTTSLPRWREEHDFVVMERDVIASDGGPRLEGQSGTILPRPDGTLSLEDGLRGSEPSSRATCSTAGGRLVGSIRLCLSSVNKPALEDPATAARRAVSKRPLRS